MKHIYNGRPYPPLMLGVIGWRAYYNFIVMYAHFANLDGDSDE